MSENQGLLQLIESKKEVLEKVAKKLGLQKLPEITIIESSIEELEQYYGREMELEDGGYYSPEAIIVRKNVFSKEHSSLTDSQIDNCAIRTVAFLLATVTYNWKYGWVGLIVRRKPDDSYWLRDRLIAKYDKAYCQVFLEP